MKVTTREGNITPEIIDQIREQPIYWSDDRNEHWFFDFKINDKWVSSVRINNELTEIIVDVL